MNKKVLIVDDAATVRMYHGKVMESAGFDVEEAVNGMEALEKAMTEKFDVLLVDVNMPKMDGYSFVQQFRASGDCEQVPVIMISTEAKQGDELKAYEAGANLYLVKPLKPDALTSAVKMILGLTLA